MPRDPKMIAFYAPNAEEYARRFCDLDDGAVLGHVLWADFPGGWPNFFIEDVSSVRGKHIVFFANFDTPDHVFKQYTVLLSLLSYGADRMTVFLPFFPTGTMERIIKPGEVVTAAPMARLLSSLPSAVSAKVQLVIYDIHQMGELHIFGDGVYVQADTALPLLEKHLLHGNDDLGIAPIDHGELAVAFPDAGAEKRFKHFFSEEFWRLTQDRRIICQKIRRGDERIIIIIEGDPAGKRILLIDDLIRTGGTLIKSGEKMIEAGALSVDAYSTHPDFETEADIRRFATAPFGRVIIGNHMGDSSRLSRICPEMAWEHLPIEELMIQAAHTYSRS